MDDDKNIAVDLLKTHNEAYEDSSGYIYFTRTDAIFAYRDAEGNVEFGKPDVIGTVDDGYIRSTEDGFVEENGLSIGMEKNDVQSK